MDEADRAGQEIDALLAEQIRAAGQKAPGITPNGQCHYCNDPAAGLFCSAECSKDYEVEQAQLRRSGKTHR